MCCWSADGPYVCLVAYGRFSTGRSRAVKANLTAGQVARGAQPEVGPLKHRWDRWSHDARSCMKHFRSKGAHGWRHKAGERVVHGTKPHHLSDDFRVYVRQLVGRYGNGVVMIR